MSPDIPYLAANRKAVNHYLYFKGWPPCLPPKHALSVVEWGTKNHDARPFNYVQSRIENGQ